MGYYYLLCKINNTSIKLKKYLLNNNSGDISLIISESFNKNFNESSKKYIYHQFSKKIDDIAINGISLERKAFDATIAFDDTNYVEINMVFEKNQWKIDNLFFSSSE